MTKHATNRAVFLDRDGVLNRNIYYPDTQAFEAPRAAAALELAEGVGDALRLFRRAGFLLILVSNQPNAVNGKCSRATLDQIHARLLGLLAAQKASLDACYYCYHHPKFTGPCACRKPSPFFLTQACAQFHLDPRLCWMVGDRPSDLACGRAAEVQTVWIDNGEGVELLDPGVADLSAGSLQDAAPRLLAASLQ